MKVLNNSQGGVLEANGTVEIKFRDRDILKTMNRLDPQLGNAVHDCNS